ncbi:EpsG family protein [Vibrio fluvialis]|uniref:EpsG family protein n=1 Tax=Vibrio fluvialis TaxID=676 RepID=UPI002ACA415A|nr:EpsG family protein [Vibrio fluvialis]MDZ5516280.1 EpsG family protein [Vibrio fluvialis]
MFEFFIIVSVFFILLSSFFNDLSKNTFIVIGLLFYSYLVAFKGGSGSDTIYYYTIFEQNLSHAETAFHEPGFGLLKDLVKYFNGDYNVINYIQSLLVFLSLFLLSRNQGVFIVSIYISLCGLTIDFSTLRQSLSFHLFVIVFFVIESRPIAAFLSSFFHYSSLFSFINKFYLLSIKRLFYLISFVVIFYFVFLNRYLDEGLQFVFRSGFSWLVLFAVYSFAFYLVGYRYRQLVFISMLLYFPIGYRVISYLLVVDKPIVIPRSFSKKLMLLAFFMLITWLKVYSFSEQSINNDKERSVILHYEDKN